MNISFSGQQVGGISGAFQLLTLAYFVAIAMVHHDAYEQEDDDRLVVCCGIHRVAFQRGSVGTVTGDY